MHMTKKHTRQPEVELLGKLDTNASKLSLPLFSEKVAAGFPSPAQDYVENELDLNELLIKHPSATYLLKVSGTSMVNAGIHPDDILIVDRSLDAKHEDIVIAMLDGCFTCKQLLLDPVAILKAYSPDHQDIALEQYGEVELFGVVTSVVKRFR